MATSVEIVEELTAVETPAEKTTKPTGANRLRKVGLYTGISVAAATAATATGIAVTNILAARRRARRPRFAVPRVRMPFIRRQQPTRRPVGFIGFIRLPLGTRK